MAVIAWLSISTCSHKLKKYSLRHRTIVQTPRGLNAFISTTICSLSFSFSRPAATEHFTSHLHPEALNKPLSIQMREREREMLQQTWLPALCLTRPRKKHQFEPGYQLRPSIQGSGLMRWLHVLGDVQIRRHPWTRIPQTSCKIKQIKHQSARHSMCHIKTLSQEETKPQCLTTKPIPIRFHLWANMADPLLEGAGLCASGHVKYSSLKPVAQ